MHLCTGLALREGLLALSSMVRILPLGKHLSVRKFSRSMVCAGKIVASFCEDGEINEGLCAVKDPSHWLKS